MTSALNPAQTMTSFQAIVNNASFSDDSYVYAKSGSVRTEGFGHYFTRCSVRASTVLQLEDAIRSQYGRDIGDSVASLLEPFRRGGQQMTVKDLRAVFERVKVLQLIPAYGEEFSGAFVAPLKKQIRLKAQGYSAQAVVSQLVKRQAELKPLLEKNAARAGLVLGEFIATPEQNRTSLRRILQKKCHVSKAYAKALVPESKDPIEFADVITVIAAACQKLEATHQALDEAIAETLQQKDQRRWSEEQKQNFRAAAYFMQDSFPALANREVMLDKLAAIVGARSGFPVLVGQKNPLALIKAFILCGCDVHSLVGEKLEALSALPPEASVRDFYNVLFGSQASLPPEREGQTMRYIQEHAGKHLQAMWQEALLTLPHYRGYLDQCLAGVKEDHPEYSAEKLHEEAMEELLGNRDVGAAQTWRKLSDGQITGFALKNQLKHLANDRLPFTQNDLALKQFIDISITGGSLAGAKEQWESDFYRQTFLDGRTTINIRVPNSKDKISVNNAMGNLSREEKARELASRHAQVYAGLQRLCGGNECQMAGAVTALCQGGIVHLNKMAAFLGIQSRQEHEPLVYDITMKDNGDLQILAHSPSGKEAPQLADGSVRHESCTLVHPNGLIEIVSFKLTQAPHPVVPAAAKRHDEDDGE